MIRVVHVGPSPEVWGGMQVVMNEMIRLQRTDPEVRVEVVQTAEVTGSPTRKLGRFGRGLASIARRCRTSPRPVLHLHTAIRTSFLRKSLVVEVAHRCGVPSILHLHGGGFDEWYEEAGPLTRRWIRRQLDRASLLVVVASPWVPFYRSLSSTPVQVVHNAIDLSALERPARSAARDPQTIAYLGRVETRKGIRPLLDAFAALRREVPRCAVRLVIAGNGDLEGAQRQATDLGVDREVEFPGWLGFEEKRELLHRADLLVLPSLVTESFGLVLVEAMAARLPVVASATGGIPDVVEDQSNGLLVPPGDVGALTAALRALVEDPVRARAMGERGNSLARERFDSHVAHQRLKGLYRELVLGSASKLEGERPDHQE